ncbi:MAG: hypothetical protein DRO36_01175 [Candidatus Hecatellales archaeon]|nr:MAG: hypothetical protein DRO36_01175 [Candidatus Hecatellales archaeon]
MVKKVFLTGVPGVGKTTVIKRVVSALKDRGMVVGGMLTFEVRKEGKRIGFEVIDVLTGKKGFLATLQGSGPKLGKYVVNLKDLVEVGVEAIRRALREADVVVVDEVGPMELFSNEFRETVKTALDNIKPLLGTVHYRARDTLIDSIKKNPNVKIFEVTFKNRDNLPEKLVRLLLP